MGDASLWTKAVRSPSSAVDPPFDRTVIQPDVEVLTIAESAIFLRSSKAHVQNLLAGKVAGALPLPFIHLGRRKLIRRESLLRWMEKSEALTQ